MKITKSRYGEFTLRKHQKDILPTLYEADNYLLAWSMRLGKSLPVLIAAIRHKGNILIVCPAKAQAGWNDTITKGRFDNSRITVISQDSLHKIPKKKKFESVIIDEIHCYRAYSERFKLLRNFTKKASKVFGLTGTPIDRAGEELFYPIMLLDNGLKFGTNKTTFYRNWCYPVDKYNYALREGKREAFTNLIMRNADTMKADYKEPKSVVIDFDLTDIQEFYMSVLLNEGIPQFLKDTSIVYNKATIYNKILQIEGGFFLENGTVHTGIYTNKWRAFNDLAKRLKGKKVVWWYYYNCEKNVIATLLGNLGIRNEFYSDKSRREFQEGDLNAIIAHTRSASTGVDLSKGDAMVYCTVPVSGIDNQQSAARFSVSGSEETKTIYTLSANKGRSKELIKLMEKKKRIQKSFYNQHIE